MFSVDPSKTLTQVSKKKLECILQDGEPQTSIEAIIDPFEDEVTLAGLQALKYESEDPDGAQSSMSLKKLESALQFCEDGLQYFPENEELSKLQVCALREQAKLDKLSAIKVEEEKRDSTEQERKLDILRTRGIVVNIELPTLCLPDSANAQFYVDPCDRIHWSLLLMYPEFGQTDFLQDVVETSSIRHCLEIVFDPNQPPPSWDQQRVYSLADDSLEVYYENGVEDKMAPALASFTLKKLTRCKGFFLRRDLVVVVHVVSRNSVKFHSRWKDGLE